MKILLAEDDEETASFIRNGLQEHGHVLDVAHDGRDAMFMAAGGGYDVIVLDRMLPNVDGLAILRVLRAAQTRTPVLVLSTLSGVNDRVTGLDAGADDYLVKPFAFSELLARVNALSRRPGLVDSSPLLKVGDLQLDRVSRVVTRAGQRVDLQPGEYRLLEFLMRNAGRVVTRTMLLEQVWEFHFDPRTSIVETQISRLRAKIERGFDEPLIETVRGAGYRLGEPR